METKTVEKFLMQYLPDSQRNVRALVNLVESNPDKIEALISLALVMGAKEMILRRGGTE